MIWKCWSAVASGAIQAFVALRPAVAAANHLQPDQPGAVDEEEEDQARKALLAQHLEIGAVIGARFVQARCAR